MGRGENKHICSQQKLSDHFVSWKGAFAVNFVTLEYLDLKLAALILTQIIDKGKLASSLISRGRYLRVPL